MSERDALLERVCANEAMTDFRAMEPELIALSQAILAGWEPSPERLRGAARRRAGYLLDVLRCWMPDARADRWACRLDLLTLDGSDGAVAFWHADARISGNDDLAKRWGLRRGLELGRLHQQLASATSSGSLQG